MFKLLVGLGLFTGVAFASLPSYAQETTTGAPATSAPVDNDDGFDLGWLGLIGLVGLAGLGGRRRHVDGVRTTSH